MPLGDVRPRPAVEEVDHQPEHRPAEEQLLRQRRQREEQEAAAKRRQRRRDPDQRRAERPPSAGIADAQDHRRRPRRRRRRATCRYSRRRRAGRPGRAAENTATKTPVAIVMTWGVWKRGWIFDSTGGSRPSRDMTKKIRVCPYISARMTDGSAMPAAIASRLPRPGKADRSAGHRQGPRSTGPAGRSAAPRPSRSRRCRRACRGLSRRRARRSGRSGCCGSG